MARTKRKYSSLSLKDTMDILTIEDFTPWQIPAGPRPPSPLLTAYLPRLTAFDLETTEQAKTLLMDALFVEIVAEYPKLKMWKAAALETDTLTGIADYLLTPKRAYVATPLLCVAEAKRDDFVQGRAQCVAEMYACQWNNKESDLSITVFGIVSNGQTWQFYKLEPGGSIHESADYSLNRLPDLLGAINYVCAESAKNAP